MCFKALLLESTRHAHFEGLHLESIRLIDKQQELSKDPSRESMRRKNKDDLRDPLEGSSRHEVKALLEIDSRSNDVFCLADSLTMESLMVGIEDLESVSRI